MERIKVSSELEHIRLVNRPLFKSYYSQLKWLFICKDCPPEDIDNCPYYMRNWEAVEMMILSEFIRT